MATVGQSVSATGVVQQQRQKAEAYSDWASRELLEDTPCPLTTYDCGILLIPDEEFDLEERILGRRTGVSGKRAGGLPIDTSSEAIEQARLGIRAARPFLSLASIQERAKALEQLQLNHFLSGICPVGSSSASAVAELTKCYAIRRFQRRVPADNASP